MKAMARQGKQDLQKHLRNQVTFLITSCREYDSGTEAEAQRLAATVRLLVHDTNRSQSLLSLLGLKSKLRFFNTSPELNQRSLGTHAGLTIMKVGPGIASHVPVFELPPRTGRAPNQRAFKKWWDGTVVVDMNRHNFSRRELVLAVANQDGGSHVDLELREAYANLTRNNSIGWRKGNSEGPFDNDIVLASVRQIAHEMLLTLQAGAPDFINDVYIRPWKSQPEEAIFDKKEVL